MQNLNYDDFMNLHEAVRTEKRLENLFADVRECDRARIEMYIMDELSEEESKELNTHIQACASCRETLDEMKELRDSLLHSVKSAASGEVKSKKKAAAQKNTVGKRAKSQEIDRQC